MFVLVAFMSASFIWRSKWPAGRFWRGFLFWAEWVVLIFVVAGVAGQLWLPEYNGLTQRVMYFGFYLWLLVIEREILRQRLPVPEVIGAGEADELAESGCEVHAAVENLPVVTDAPLQS